MVISSDLTHLKDSAKKDNLILARGRNCCIRAEGRPQGGHRGQDGARDEQLK